MPAYNYKARFADDVENLRKRQTVRLKRQRPTKPGDTLYHYTGMRTKTCRKLLEIKCKSVTPVDLDENGNLWVDNKLLTIDETVAFAQADGFDGLNQFFDFFEDHYGLPLFGELEVIKW